MTKREVTKMLDHAEPAAEASPAVPPQLPESARTLEYQDMLRQEALAERKSLVVGLAASALTAVALVGLAGVLGASERWGWWAVIPGVLLALPAMMLVVAASQTLRQATPVPVATLFASRDEVVQLDTMTTVDWLNYRLIWAGPPIIAKLRRLQSAVDIVAGSLGLMLGGGFAVLAFEAIGLGR